MKKFSYREYNEYLSRLMGLSEYLKAYNDISSKIELYKRKDGKQLYRFLIDGEIDGYSFSQIAWAGMQDVNGYIPEGSAIYFGDRSKSFSAHAKKTATGTMVYMNVNGFDEKADGKKSAKIGSVEQTCFEELAIIVADANKSGYRISFTNMNEKYLANNYRRDVVGMKMPSEVVDEM